MTNITETLRLGGAAVPPDMRRSWPWALRALKRELLDFRFEYPVEFVPESRQSGSPHYHVFSERLFLEDLEFDANGVAMKRYRAIGQQYNPLFVAWWGLYNLERFLRGADGDGSRTFLNQVEWLRASAVERADGAAVWPCHFDWQEGRCRMRAPWISAMYQSVVVSALIRACRLTGDRSLLPLCRRAVKVFEQDVADGGVRTVENGAVLYEEYPGYPLPRVMDGFLFSLLGLYDLAVETKDPDVRRMFDLGIHGLRRTIDAWDYRGKWSWYGSHGYLCPPHYHTLNRLLLSILGRLTADDTLLLFADAWHTRDLDVFDKAEVYAMFVMTKNLARLRLPRN